MPLTVEIDGRAAIYDLRTAFDMLSDEIDPVDLIRAVDAGAIVPVLLRNRGAALVSAPGQVPAELRQPQQLALIPLEGPPQQRFEVGVQMLFPIRATVRVNAPDAEAADRIITKVLKEDEPVEGHGFELEFDQQELREEFSYFMENCQWTHPATFGIEHHVVETAYAIIEGE